MYLKELTELLRRLPPDAGSRPEYVQKGASTDQWPPLAGPAESQCFQLVRVDRGVNRSC